MPPDRSLDRLLARSRPLLWAGTCLVAGLLVFGVFLPAAFRSIGPYVAAAFATLFIVLAVAGLVVALLDEAATSRWRRLNHRVHAGLCPACTYDLRASARRCPECGADVVAARLEVAVAGKEPGDAQSRRRVEAAAAAASCPVEAVAFVRRAFWYADLVAGAANYRNGLTDAAVHVSGDVGAADVCRAVADIAAASLGGRAEAVETLRRWGVRRGEDVGRIVFAMVEAELLHPSRQDAPEDFRGAFDVERDV